MTDIGMTTSSVPDAAANAIAGHDQTAPGAPAPGVAPTTPAPSSEADPFAELPAERAVFDRGYVESLRSEGAKYRTEAGSTRQQLQGYEDVFSVYEPDDRQVWLDLARTWATDPAKAAAVMQTIASSVLGEQAGGDGDAGSPPPGSPADTPILGDAVSNLTPDQVKALVAEELSARDSARAEQQAVADVFSEVRAAGFDPESAEGFMVLYNANHYTGGDITKAVAMTGEYKQKIIDEYVQGRSGGRAMPAPSGGVVATSNGEAITSIDDARKATDRFLQERRLAQ
jgi:hypothetical protein